MSSKNTGNSIQADLGDWNFGEGVESKFDDHVRKSVPGYDISHYIALLLSDPFIKRSSNVLDIGCSTGTFARMLYARHSHKQPNIVGIDKQQNMLDKAIELDKSENLVFKNLDLIENELPQNNDLVSSFYTMQFIPPSVRQDVINKIFESLNWGGGFFLFEKVRAPDARFQDYINHAFMNFKLESFNAEEVVAKSNSLIGVMEPFSSQGNIDLLKRAGFVDICTVSKLLCFEGLLAIK